MDDIGFIGSGSRFNPRFGSGDQVTAKQLNDLATGIQNGLSMPYLGDGPSISFTSGGTIITPIETSIGGDGGGLKQFDCFIQKWQDPENPEADPEYRLRCVRGLTSFENYNVDEKGFITDEVFVYNHRLNKWNVWMTGSFEYDPNDESKIYLDDGYIKLEKTKNYKVFIYKVNPTVDAWPESQSAQIAIIEEGSPADENVIQKYSGGGSMQVYLVSKTESIENIVTADPMNGSIANFNPAEMLNDYINFDPSYLSVTRAVGNPLDPNERHPNLYPSGMSDWLSYEIPAFAKPSTSQFAQTIDGMIIGGVPNDFAGDGILGKVLGYPVNGVEYGYSGYAGNYLQNDVVKAWDVNERYGFTSNPYVSGLINPADFEIIIYNDLSENTVVNFDNADLDIIANTQTAVSSTTLEMATGGAVGNVGFKYFDCARKEIAYIKWIAIDPEKPDVKEHFDIYQINNGPINFNYKPILLDVKKVETDADAHWGTDNDSWVSPDVVEISSWGDYEDNLISNKYKENDANIGGFLPNHPTRSSG